MANRKIFKQIFTTYIILVLLSIAAVLFFSTGKIEKHTIAQKQKDLESMATLIAERVLLIDEEDIDDYCEKLGEAINCRITVVSAEGKVLGDTQKRASFMDNHINREEIIEALQDRSGKSIRFSSSVKKDMLYVAVPIKDRQGQIVGVARVSVSNDAVNRIIDGVVDSIILAGLATAIVAGLVSVVVSNKISKPLVLLRAGAEEFTNGNLKHRLPTDGSYETSTLAVTMNSMAKELDKKINDMIAQRTRQDAILSSMTEAVVAVDNYKTLITANDAAISLFNIPDNWLGRPLQEAARNPQLHKIVDAMLEKHTGIIDNEITIFKDNKPVILQIHATVLSTDTEALGVLVVLNDVTKLKKLENIRKEFVANVSHELKTPITSIKGFVETLQDGAINDSANAAKFLDIVARQTNRLEMIIDDLLSLSRIEQLEDSSQVEFSLEAVMPVISSAAGVCQRKAADKSITIDCSGDKGITAMINRNLIEQAVVNLIDNAVKYSERGQKVEVAVCVEAGKPVISVKDYGCGIPKEEFSRLFERFYRVDRARSRELGGTGLGLSIVKHIVNVHKGNVSVQSEPGKGSLFKIELPI